MVKPRNNGMSHGDTVDSVTLLDSTDSDVEWLNLPPLKGKKPKRKQKAGKSNSRENDGCGLWTFMKPILYILVLGAVVLLTVTTVWLTAQVSDLRAKLDKVEGKSVANIEDIQKLFSQLSVCNKSLEAEAKRLTQVQTNISTINTTISRLSDDVTRLGDGLKSAPELKQLPDKLQTVSKTLADLGSDVEGMKGTVSGLQTSMTDTGTKLQEFGSQLDTLKQTSDGDKATDNELSPEISNMIQSIQQRLEDMNSTLSAKVSLAMKSLNQHEERFAQLDNITEMLRRNMSKLTTDHSSISDEHASMTDVYTSDQFKTGVTDIVNTVLAATNFTEATAGEGAPLSSALLISVKDTLNKLKERYDNISVTVQKNKEDIGDIKETFVTTLKFDSVKEGFLAAIVNLNVTLMDLKSQVDMKAASVTLASPLPTQPVANSDQQNNGTAIQATDKPSSASSTQAPTQAITQAPTQAPSKEPTQTPTKEATQAPPKDSTQAPTQDSTQAPKTEPPEMKRSTPDASSHIHIPGIDTFTDLEIKFHAWDRYGSGKIAYDILDEFMGESKPLESDLEQFDEDHDGFYTIQEMASALGITLEKDLPTEETADKATDQNNP